MAVTSFMDDSYYKQKKFCSHFLQILQRLPSLLRMRNDSRIRRDRISSVKNDNLATISDAFKDLIKLIKRNYLQNAKFIIRTCTTQVINFTYSEHNLVVANVCYFLTAARCTRKDFRPPSHTFLYFLILSHTFS